MPGRSPLPVHNPTRQARRSGQDGSRCEDGIHLGETTIGTFPQRLFVSGQDASTWARAANLRTHDATINAVLFQLLRTESREYRGSAALPDARQMAPDGLVAACLRCREGGEKGACEPSDRIEMMCEKLFTRLSVG